MIAGLILVAAIAFASCGGSKVTESPTAGTDSPSDDAAISAMVVTRTGGIAGVHDTVQIAADGTAQITSRTGGTRNCTPSPGDLDRLRTIDLAAVGTAPPKSPIMDGFNYSVSSATGSASASDGDNQGLRAELLTAAAAVLASCMATESESAFPDM